MIDTDVLVVGAGPGGLATAVTALRHGARVLVVERRSGTSTIPRATGLSTHTMELFRCWGIADAVRAGSIECDPVSTVTHALTGQPSEVVPLPSPTLREALSVSPTYPALCPQDHVEPLLVAQVRRLGCEIRFGTRLTGMTVTPDGVDARLAGAAGGADPRRAEPRRGGCTDLDGAGRVRARFVVGADGPRSTVRTLLGIEYEHLGTLGEFVQLLFRPDLAPALAGPPPALVFVEQPDVAGVLLPVGAGRWVFVHQWHPERGEHPSDYTPARWTGLLRAATGISDLEPEIIGTQSFTMAAEVASTYRAGPGFLVGDAAHRMTPVGGRGMNTAVHDGHELGWRLAWAVRGLAGGALLDSYDTERRPVGRANAQRSLNWGGRDPHDGLPGDLGRSYRSAVITADDDPPARGHDRTARAGERAPHTWIRRGTRRTSVLDLFENRLTLLTGSGEHRWTRAVASLPGIPIEIIPAGPARPGQGQSALVRTYQLGPGSAVLVRPDGIVAWRHDGPCTDHDAALFAAVSTTLGRTLAPTAVAV